MEEKNEFQESLSNMIKSSDMADVKLAIGIVSNNPEMIKDVWYDINNYITADTHRYAELYCKEGTSDKVYIIVLNKIKKGYVDRWTEDAVELQAYYGKRGKSMRNDYKGNGNLYYIDRQFEDLMDEKIHKKGYTLINEVTN